MLTLLSLLLLFGGSFLLGIYHMISSIFFVLKFSMDCCCYSSVSFQKRFFLHRLFWLISFICKHLSLFNFSFSVSLLLCVCFSFVLIFRCVKNFESTLFCYLFIHLISFCGLFCSEQVYQKVRAKQIFNCIKRMEKSARELASKRMCDSLCVVCFVWIWRWITHTLAHTFMWSYGANKTRGR